MCHKRIRSRLLKPWSTLTTFNPDHVAIVIHNYRWRIGLAAGDPKYGQLADLGYGLRPAAGIAGLASLKWAAGASRLRCSVADLSHSTRGPHHAVGRSYWVSFGFPPGFSRHFIFCRRPQNRTTRAETGRLAPRAERSGVERRHAFTGPYTEGEDASVCYQGVPESPRGLAKYGPARGAPDYESVGRGFKSLRARHIFMGLPRYRASVRCPTAGTM